MTIPTSDVQINEIMRKVKEDLRLKLIGDDHPLSTDSRKQEEQTAWLLDSLLGTLGQFANLPTRPTTRRFRRNSRGIPSTNGMPMTSSPAMVEQINHMMSDTASGTDAPESAQPNGQGFAAANFQHQLMQPPPLAPSQMTFNSLPTAQLPILNRSRLSDQNLPISHGHVHYQRQNRTQQSFLDHQQLLLQQQFLSEQLFPSSAALGEPSTTPFALISYPGINKYTSAKMSTSQQPTYDQQQQMYGQQENFGQQQNFNQHQDQVQPHMRESEFSRAADLLCSPPIPNSLHETLDASSATGLLPQSNQTIDPNLLSAIDPYFAFVGSQYFSAANPTPPDP
jgi:hypothetical protein